MNWLPIAKIIAHGYLITDEARVLTTSFEGGIPRQSQPHGAAFTVRTFDFYLASDADFLELQNWVRQVGLRWFGFRDDEDGITRQARLRAGNGISYDTRIAGGYRTWQAQAVLEGWLDPTPIAQPLSLSRWPTIADVIATNYQVNDDAFANRAQFDDGAWRQTIPYASGMTRRALSFWLPNDAALLRFRDWARRVTAIGGEFAFSDIADAGLTAARIRGGLAGIQYRAEVDAGARGWAGNCELESIGDNYLQN